MTQARYALSATLKNSENSLFFNGLARLSHAWDSITEKGLKA